MEVIFINDVILIGVATTSTSQINTGDLCYQKIAIEVPYSSKDKRTVLINCLVTPKLLERFKKQIMPGDSIGIQGYLSFDDDKNIVVIAEDCTSFKKQPNL
ncbi:hypothetical protein ASO20_02375 [Mycoplasma sp. (ex Biomphalaria glabrata)]|uniref:OB-fold nucleic acid binding domain-containing protein n=1 Tax=Mycoplasma sp. (ex Biomphalaria glabrata) TaxID=1749074 RepID=UPI00073AE24F|nr:OB-fold nucleic acid binding domain-containing protein [Mycoplasma sp. (ex Biomphalaria glabrata)]ALV23480.1 hypothetical protein ASO20_02375 [Mycoplasma sp. (ex Biomphalaria glabrata)]